MTAAQAREQCKALCERANRDFMVFLADDPRAALATPIILGINKWSALLVHMDGDFALFTNNRYYDRAITWALECLRRLIVEGNNSDFMQIDAATPVFASPCWSMVPATVEDYYDPALPGNDR